jgi:TM2 domain-containing membrane protein YozV
MELGINQIILFIIGITVAVLLIIFMISKIGSDGSVTNIATDLLKTSTDNLGN